MAASMELLLLVAHDEGDLDDEELVIFYEYMLAGPPPIPHRNYARFDINRYTDEECITSFRFQKPDLAFLATAMRLPERFVCKNGTVACRMEGLCMFLRRLAYPNRLTDIISMFGRSKSELIMIFSCVVDFIFDQHHSLLTTLDVPWLTAEKLEEMASAVHEKGAALENAWGFVDGTVIFCY